MNRLLLLPVGLAISVLAGAQASITGFGVPAGPSDYSYGYAVSRDGTYCAGQYGRNGFLWSQSGGLQIITPPSGYSGIDVTGVADNGTLVGNISDSTVSRGYIRSPQGGFTVLQPFSGYSGCRATQVSADASTVVGYCTKRTSTSPFVTTYTAFRRTNAEGMVPFASSTDSVYLEDCSGDGSVIVGRIESKAFRWTASSGVQYLSGSEATTVSSDGRFTLGVGSGSRSTRWDNVGPTSEIVTGDYPTGVSGNGAVAALGISIWFRGANATDFFTYLQKNGADLSHWRKLFIQDISDDGRILVGRGTNEFAQSEAFRAVITPPGGVLPPEIKSLEMAPDPRVGGNDVTLYVTLQDPYSADLFIDSHASGSINTTLLDPVTNPIYPGWSGVFIKSGKLQGIQKVLTRGTSGRTDLLYIDYLGLRYPVTIHLLSAFIYDPVVTATTVRGGTVVRCTVRLNGQAPQAGASLDLSSSDATGIPLPDHVSYGSYAREVSFPIATQKVQSNKNVTVKFTYFGRSKTVTFTLTP